MKKYLRIILALIPILLAAWYFGPKYIVHARAESDGTTLTIFQDRMGPLFFTTGLRVETAERFCAFYMGHDEWRGFRYSLVKKDGLVDVYKNGKLFGMYEFKTDTFVESNGYRNTAMWAPKKAPTN